MGNRDAHAEHLDTASISGPQQHAVQATREEFRSTHSRRPRQAFGRPVAALPPVETPPAPELLPGVHGAFATNFGDLPLHARPTTTRMTPRFDATAAFSGGAREPDKVPIEEQRGTRPSIIATRAPAPPNSSHGARCSCGKPVGPDGQCVECRARNQRRASRNRRALHSTWPGSAVKDLLTTPARALSPNERELMEAGYRADFSTVRIHRGPQVTAMARSAGALAFTIADHIFASDQRLNPDRDERILAHEIAHVVQWRNGAPTALAPVPVAHTSEREAEAAADAVATTGAPVAIGSSAVGLHRYAGPPTATASQIQAFRALVRQYAASLSEGAIAAEDAAAVGASIAESESAIALAAEATTAGAALVTGAETATAVSAGLAADDVTVIGVADDAAIPFLLLAAAVLAGTAAGYYGPRISAAWDRAAQAVARAIAVIRQALTRSARSRQAGPKADRERSVQTLPDVDVEPEERQGCRAFAVVQRGGNSCHDTFATAVSGQAREWGVVTPEGAYASFDGYGRDGVLYEIKTGYRYLLSIAETTRTLRQRTIGEFVDQAQHQLFVATRCGYTLVWVFNDAAVAQMVDGIIEPQVEARPFSCDRDA